MRNAMPNGGRSNYFTVREAAAVLNVKADTISRAVRVGTLRAVRRRGRLVIPASALVRLLGRPTDDGRKSGGRP